MARVPDRTSTRAATSKASLVHRPDAVISMRVCEQIEAALPARP